MAILKFRKKIEAEAQASDSGNTPDLTQVISSNSQMVIKQKRELSEIFLGVETRNQYLIFDQAGVPCGRIAEQGRGFKNFLKRILLKSHRPFNIHVIDGSDKVILEFSRPFFFFFSELTVKSSEGQILGSVKRRFGLLTKIYDLKDSKGQTFTRIQSSIFKIWTFSVRDDQRVEVARISKKWSGLLKELFTDSDNFIIEFGNKAWSASQRAILFAAAISIDFDFFENNNRK